MSNIASVENLSNPGYSQNKKHPPAALMPGSF